MIPVSSALAPAFSVTGRTKPMTAIRAELIVKKKLFAVERRAEMRSAISTVSLYRSRNSPRCCESSGAATGKESDDRAVAVKRCAGTSWDGGHPPKDRRPAPSGLRGPRAPARRLCPGRFAPRDFESRCPYPRTLAGCAKMDGIAGFNGAHPTPRRLRLRYAAACAVCRCELVLGTEAWCDSEAKLARAWSAVAAPSWRATSPATAGASRRQK